jgi:hypothetical protein
MGNTTIREVVSRGNCFQVDESVLLSERETDVPRRLELTRQGFRETNTSREFESCVHPSALICRGENPFSVDGVRLGMTLAEVEARWGEMSEVHCGWRAFQSQLDENMVALDSSGRVTWVSGLSLYEFSRPINYNESKTYGHPHPNSGYAHSYEIIVGDYHVSLDREGPEENGKYLDLLPGYYAPFVDDRIRKKKKFTVSLSYRFD